MEFVQVAYIIIGIVVAVLGFLIKNLIDTIKTDVVRLKADFDEIEKKSNLSDSKIVEMVAKVNHLDNTITRELDHMKKLQEVRHEYIKTALEDIKEKR